MKNTKKIIGAVTLFASFGFVAMPATAASANISSCNKAANAVEAALESNQNSAHYDQAQKLRRAALQYCHAGMYKMGMSRYSAALKVLGADKTAATGADSKS